MKSNMCVRTILRKGDMGKMQWQDFMDKNISTWTDEEKLIFAELIEKAKNAERYEKALKEIESGYRFSLHGNAIAKQALS